MPKRHKPNITLTLPAEPPTQPEIDAILMATDALIGTADRVSIRYCKRWGETAVSPPI